MLLNMRGLLRYFDNYVDEELFSDENIYASRTHLGIINQGKQPYIYSNQFFGWLEGEFYNQNELRDKYRVVSNTDSELLLSIYGKTRSFDFLRDIDGCYTAIVYDKKEDKVCLITDRYGFKPLYWGMINDDLVWSSELKGFLGHIDFKPVINRQAVEEFFDIGYLLENRTWFVGVELVPPASILSFDIKSSKVQIQHYWSWNEIKLMKEPIDEKELAKELGRLFKSAVRKRVNNNERIGIMLSGGLDSRAILAAVPEDYKPLHTFTFGQKGCDDIRIAPRASRIKGATHHILEINSNNWLMPRINGVWKSDASFSLLHMHGIEFCGEYKSYIDFNLNGFEGGPVMGGWFVTFCPDQSEEYMVRNYSRRFVNQALILGEAWLIHRRPFVSKDLIDYAFSIPESLRQNSYIYNKMLLSTFPKYYNDIPWQSSSTTHNPNRLTKLLELKNRVVNKLRRGFQELGFDFKDLSGYADYPAWIRQEPAKPFFENLLLNKNALYPEYIDRNKIHSYLRDHMERKGNYRNELCLALTFELWLQQVFEGKYRD